MPKRWLTVPAVAAYLGVTTDTVRSWIKAGALRAGSATPHYADERPRKTVRRTWRVYEDDFQDFLSRLRGHAVKTRVPARYLSQLR